MQNGSCHGEATSDREFMEEALEVLALFAETAADLQLAFELRLGVTAGELNGTSARASSPATRAMAKKPRIGARPTHLRLVGA